MDDDGFCHHFPFGKDKRANNYGGLEICQSLRQAFHNHEPSLSPQQPEVAVHLIFAIYNDSHHS